MNYLQICLTSKCNRACWHCPMAEYRNTDDKDYHLTNSVIIPWIKSNIRPKLWLVELTGGEPTLYEGIDELLDWLSTEGYTVHIRTNGIIPVESRQGLKRIVAFHDLQNPPKVFDHILIIDQIESDEKIRYCLEHRLPYTVIGKDKSAYDNATHGFKYIAYVEPSCHHTRCPAAQPIPEIKEVNGKMVDVTRLEYERFSVSLCCAHCKAAVDAWRFL